MSHQMDDEPTYKKHQLKEPPVWKPYHWADKIIHKEKHRQVIIANAVVKKWNELVSKKFEKLKAQQFVSDSPYGDDRVSESLWDNDQFYYLREMEQESQAVSADEYILEFGNQTLQQIKNAIENSFKVFWDGSVSIFRDAVLVSIINK